MTDIPHILGGRYEVGDLIGRGGMAQVHLGYDTRLSRTVAIKVLRSDLASDPTFLARFRREAQSAAALNHPAIVAVYDTGEEKVLTTNGRAVALPYIVMEYVKGRTVSKLLKNGQALPINEAVQITVGVLSALEYSHYEGIVHRDIKPGNIMITQDGKVKVMDFGIARAVADSSATMTSTNSVVGTAQYLSPEQARGEVVDARSDLYSTGCLLYELLTGKPPFQGDSAVAVAYQHVSATPKPPSAVAPDVPDAIDRVVMKSLAKKRDERYQTAAQMRNDLLAASRGEAVMAPAINVWDAQLQPPAVTGGTATMISPVIPAPAAGTESLTSTATDIAPAIVADEEEEEEPPSHKKAWIIAAVIIAILTIAGVSFALAKAGVFGGSSAEVTMVEVPDMTAMNEQEATQALADQGLKIKVGKPIEDPEIPEGIFVSSRPGAGESVAKGTAVTVYFSAGTGEVTVPDVTGGKLTQQQARETLKKAGLTVGNVETTDEPGIKEGMVVSTDPAPGSAVAKNTAVTLFIASGQVQIPSLVGMSLTDAQNALNTIKVGYDTEQVSSAEPQGTVLDQSPAAGKQAVDVRVKLTISNGKAQQVPPPNTGGTNPDSGTDTGTDTGDTGQPPAGGNSDQ